MRFVRGKTLARELRGQHIADKLCVPCSTELGEPEPGEWVVFVKKNVGLEEAKVAGCHVAFDPVDLYCYPGRITTPAPEVDLLIMADADRTSPDGTCALCRR